MNPSGASVKKILIYKTSGTFIGAFLSLEAHIRDFTIRGAYLQLGQNALVKILEAVTKSTQTYSITETSKMLDTF